MHPRQWRINDMYQFVCIFVILIEAIWIQNPKPFTTYFDLIVSRRGISYPFIKQRTIILFWHSASTGVTLLNTMAEIPINDVDLNPDDTIDDNEDQPFEPFKEHMAPFRNGSFNAALQCCGITFPPRLDIQGYSLLDAALPVTQSGI